MDVQQHYYQNPYKININHLNTSQACQANRMILILNYTKVIRYDSYRKDIYKEYFC